MSMEGELIMYYLSRCRSMWSRSYPPFRTQVALQLWDTAGQERFRSMAPMYYRGATAAIIVFDSSKEFAWDAIKTWQKVKYGVPCLPSRRGHAMLLTP
mmetsp:Transcript_24684/g.81850  ORF Transcript_24684/g.81850 Transcript_24684/m.81850 type:complete len:98 (-) Transcript_24684:704-997(-)